MHYKILMFNQSRNHLWTLNDCMYMKLYVITHYRIVPTILALKTIHLDIQKWSLLLLQKTILKNILPLIQLNIVLFRRFKHTSWLNKKKKFKKHETFYLIVLICLSCLINGYYGYNIISKKHTLVSKLNLECINIIT